MKITFKYFAQSRQVTGRETEQLEISDGSKVTGTLGKLAEQYGHAFRSLVLDEKDSVRPSIMILIDGQPLPHGKDQILNDGNEVSIFSPVAGG
jgi:MoaD family protein